MIVNFHVGSGNRILASANIVSTLNHSPNCYNFFLKYSVELSVQLSRHGTFCFGSLFYYWFSFFHKSAFSHGLFPVWILKILSQEIGALHFDYQIVGIELIVLFLYLLYSIIYLSISHPWSPLWSCVLSVNSWCPFFFFSDYQLCWMLISFIGLSKECHFFLLLSYFQFYWLLFINFGFNLLAFFFFLSLLR